jgi:uncharacterized protein
VSEATEVRTGARQQRVILRRSLLTQIEHALEVDGCALLVGPYEVGKSELAREVVRRFGSNGHYLSARKQGDRERLVGTTGLVSNSAGKLLVIDEIDRFPDALDFIHLEIEAARYEGKTIGRFLVLGARSPEAEMLTSNALGTRAHTFHLAPVHLSDLRTADGPNTETMVSFEVEQTAPIARPVTTIPMEALWLRGGFPRSLTASSEDESFSWRQQYLSKLCARGYEHLHPALASSSVYKFLERVAALHGGTLDVNSLPPPMRPCLAYFEDLGLIRQLRPWFSNQNKRLEKPHKVYMRDSGLLHCLLGRRTLEEVRASDSVFGHSWEGFCIENLIAAAGPQVTAYFYRKDDNEELDLILEYPGQRHWAIEMKGPSTRLTAGFDRACREVGAIRSFVIRPVPESYGEGGRQTLTLADAIDVVGRGPQ